MKDKFKFNPENFGFEPIEKFPELWKADYYGSNTFIKIIENGGKEFGRKVFWYIACSLNTQIFLDNDRIRFYEHSFDVNKTITENFDGFGSKPRITYFSLIDSEEYAIQLLRNLFGTLKNDSAQTIGKERLERNINDDAK